MQYHEGTYKSSNSKTIPSLAVSLPMGEASTANALICFINRGLVIPASDYKKNAVIRQLKINGKIIARTKFSRSWRGKQQISEPIQHAQTKQMHCPSRTLKLLLQGCLNKKEYLRELLEGQVITHIEFNLLCGEGSR